jgi:hypothetical protein
MKLENEWPRWSRGERVRTALGRHPSQEQARDLAEGETDRRRSHQSEPEPAVHPLEGGDARVAVGERALDDDPREEGEGARLPRFLLLDHPPFASYAVATFCQKARALDVWAHLR